MARTTRLFSAFATTLGLAGCVHAASPVGKEFPLWGMTVPPGSRDVVLAEQAVNRSDNPDQPDRMLSGIARPSLTAFLPARPNGVAVVVAPGGSYTKLAYDKEGVEVATWLNAKGISVFVLKYRLPDEGHQTGRLVPLQDGLRAIRLLRSQSAQWHIDPARIGIIGFSAGGHLAAATGLDFSLETHAPVDAVDAASARPDFVALIYGAAAFRPRPADTVDRPESSLAYTASGTLDRVSKQTPPTFIMIADDDPRVPPESNVALWQALHQAHVPVELHVALRGGHGFGLRPQAAESVKSWPALFETWLHALGMIR